MFLKIVMACYYMCLYLLLVFGGLHNQNATLK